MGKYHMRIQCRLENDSISRQAVWGGTRGAAPKSYRDLDGQGGRKGLYYRSNFKLFKSLNLNDL
jgi:hypothetical protein